MRQIRQPNAANPWPAACEPRPAHGRAYGHAENGLGRAGNGQRKRPRCGAWPWLAWRYGVRFGGWWLVSQYS